MIYYYCNDQKNYDDADFLSDFDKVIKKIDKDFSVAWFPHQVNNLTSLDFLIIDIFACHDSQSDLIENLVTLKNYNGINPIIYIPKDNIKDSSSIVRDLKKNDIPVLYKREFQEEMTKIMHKLYNIQPLKIPDVNVGEVIRKHEVLSNGDDDLGITKNDKDLIKKIIEILEVNDE